MKRLKCNELEAGMITADEVCTPGGQRVLDKGMTLNRQLIMRLSFYQIDTILVEDAAPAPDTKNDSGQTAHDPGSSSQESAYSAKVRSSPRFYKFRTDHSIVMAVIKSSLDGYVKQGIPPQPEDLLEKACKLFASCKTTLDLFDMLNNMRSDEDSIYVHSLNVALICRRLGKWLKMSPEELDLLTLCGIFHDIGKLKIPAEILNKPGKYTDEEFQMVKNHPKYGYDLLEPLPLDTHIKNAALYHHERSDGSGYPLGITQQENDDYAMIVAIADVYDAMTAARSYRAPLCPFRVIANFEKEGLQKYKPKYILTFLSHIAGTYQNNQIRLNDGRDAKIIMLNQNSLSRPVVQLDDGSCIDLSSQRGLQIDAIL